MPKPVLWFAIIAAAFAPMLRYFFQQLWSTPHTSFLVFVPCLVAWLFYSRWNWTSDATQKSSVATLTFLTLLSGALLAAAILIFNPWLSAVACVIFAGVLLRVALSSGNARYAWGIWALLWLMIPLPLGLDQQLITSLQLLSSSLSSRCLDLLGIIFDNSGNVLSLVGHELFVDEACSGIVSLMTIIGCSAAFGVLQNRPPLHILLLMLGAALCATIMNTVRIVLIVVGLEWFQVDLLKGAPHELLGMFLFGITLCMLASLDQSLQFVWMNSIRGWPAFSERMQSSNSSWLSALIKPPAIPSGEVSSNHRWSQIASSPIMRMTLAVFSPIAMIQLAMLIWLFTVARPTEGDIASAVALSQQSLPSEIDGLRMARFENSKRDSSDILGEFSRTYIFVANDGQSYTVSCDFPFGNGWHELSVCYLSSGWRIETRESLEMDGSSNNYVRVSMSRSDGQHGYVAWTLFDEFGQYFSPPAQQWLDQLWQVIVRRNPHMPSKKLYQVQVLVAGPVEVSAAHRAVADQLLKQVSVRLREAIVQGAK